MINRFRDLLLSDACFYSMDRCVVLFRQSFSQHITPEAKNRLTAYFLATELENELNRTSFYKANPALLYPAGVYSLKTIRDSLDNRTRPANTPSFSSQTTQNQLRGTLGTRS